MPLTSILVKEYKLNKRNEKSIENINIKSSKLYLRWWNIIKGKIIGKL
jgi:hypothetical protein